MSVGPRAHIFPGALEHNFRRIRERAPGCRIMAAVKGNAYGHGLLTAAQAFDGADSLAVARLVEARALRAAGCERPLVLLSGPLTPAELGEAAALACEIVVHTEAQLPLLEEHSTGRFTVWLKVDTGMHRLGFLPGATSAVLARLRAARAVAEVRLMTHLATADDPADAMGARQVAAFMRLSRAFDGAVSVDNSAALIGDVAPPPTDWGHRGDTWVRPGIALYGISPFPSLCGRELGLVPAMHLDTRLIDTKPVARGERVGYGGRWRAARDTVIGIVAAGYADGYTRFLPSGTPLWINGRRVPLAGTVSMDLAAVDLGAGSSDRVGDRVQLWGDELPVEEVARAAGTIAYQLVTGLTHREPPVIENGSEED